MTTRPHTVAAELAAELGLTPVGPAASVLAPNAYVTMLYKLGMRTQHIRLQVYGFELPTACDVIKWTKGTLLTGYRAQLDDETYNDFERRYRRRMPDRLGDQHPYIYAFKRILVWARQA